MTFFLTRAEEEGHESTWKGFKELLQRLCADPFYRRLIKRGKPHKVALIAAMRKLLAAVYSVAKHRRPFVPFFNPQ